MSTILVAGATGYLGGEVCRRLVVAEKRVRAVVRRTSGPERIAHLEALGIDLVEADLKDPGSLDDACRGVDTVISTVSTTFSRQPGDSIESVDRDGQLALVDAARAAGARHFVYVSYSRLDDDDPCPLTTAKRAVEGHLKARSAQVSPRRMTYTILRPTFFMDIWLGSALGFDVAGGRVTVFGSGHAGVSWIALGDVAQFAVEAVDSPAARDASIDLGGPETLSYAEVIALAERLRGRPLEVQSVSEATLEAQRAGAPDDLVRSIAGLQLAAARGSVVDMRDTSRRLPIRLTSVETHLARALGARVAGGAPV
jgi:NADH dehydrogenase